MTQLNQLPQEVVNIKSGAEMYRIVKGRSLKKENIAMYIVYIHTLDKPFKGVIYLNNNEKRRI